MADQKSKGGRPSAEDLRQRQIEEILDRHADGEALTDICASFSPPLPPRTFRSWCRKQSKLREAWEMSDKDFVHALFDKYASVTAQLAVGQFGKEDNARVQALRAAQDGYKNICARLNPGKYAEQKDKKAGITVIINSDLPMETGVLPPATIDGDFTLKLDPKKLEGPRG